MHRFDPAHLHRLVSPERDAWLHPQQVLDALHLRPGLKVVDFGSGPGYFTLPVAERVGSSGTVFALDAEQAMLEALQQRATAAAVSNIFAILNDARNIPLPDAIADRALLSLVLHEMPDRSLLLSEVSRLLRPQGRLVVVEWQPWQTEHGPSPGERLAPETLADELQGHGFIQLAFAPLGDNCYVMTAHTP